MNDDQLLILFDRLLVMAIGAEAARETGLVDGQTQYRHGVADGYRLAAAEIRHKVPLIALRRPNPTYERSAAAMRP